MRFTSPQIWWWTGWSANVSRDDAQNKQKGEEQEGQSNKLFFRGSACKFIWLHDENVWNEIKITLSLFRTQCILCHLSSQATCRLANAATGLLRNSDADVTIYFCCLHVAIIPAFLLLLLTFLRIFLFAIYTALLATNVCWYVLYWSNTLQARRQRFVRFVNRPQKKRIYESKQNLIMKTKQGNDANNLDPEHLSHRQ